MDATQAAEAMAGQAGEEVATEVVENAATGDQEVVPTDESVLPSDEAEATELSEMDQLREQIAGLEAKVKKGKDASSQRGQADKDASDARESGFYPFFKPRYAYKIVIVGSAKKFLALGKHPIIALFINCVIAVA
jgi:PleD family two-component response regulator